MMIHDVMDASARPDFAISCAEFPPHQTRALARPIAHARRTLPPFLRCVEQTNQPRLSPLCSRRSQVSLTRSPRRLTFVVVRTTHK